MTTIYSYSINTDFGGNIKEEQLYNEIVAETGITGGNLIAVNSKADDVEIIFNSFLSSAEQIILNNLISNHTPINSKAKENFFAINPRKNLIKSKKWFVSSHFKYDGPTIGDIDYFELVSRMDNGITNYDVRIINRDNGDILVEKLGMNNTLMMTSDLGPVTNIPSSDTILELQIKKNGGNNSKKVEIDQLIIYYGNSEI